MERAAEITWLSSEEIKAAAITFATTKPAAIGPGPGGACQYIYVFDLSRLVTILAAITGNLVVKGGNVSHIPPTKARSCYGEDYRYDNTLPREQARKKIGRDKFLALNFPGMATTQPQFPWLDQPTFQMCQLPSELPFQDHPVS